MQRMLIILSIIKNKVIDHVTVQIADEWLRVFRQVENVLGLHEIE
jgi:hypothetical protein